MSVIWYVEVSAFQKALRYIAYTMSIERFHCIPVCGEIKGSVYTLTQQMYSQRLYYMSYIEQLVVEWVNSNSRDAATSLGGILPDLEVPVATSST